MARPDGAESTAGPGSSQSEVPTPQENQGLTVDPGHNVYLWIAGLVIVTVAIGAGTFFFSTRRSKRYPIKAKTSDSLNSYFTGWMSAFDWPGILPLHLGTRTDDKLALLADRERVRRQQPFSRESAEMLLHSRNRTER
jgi:hypothetical protein